MRGNTRNTIDTAVLAVGLGSHPKICLYSVNTRQISNNPGQTMTTKPFSLLIVGIFLLPAVAAADQLTQIIQQDLVTLGYEPGNTDGEGTVATAIAISKFQAEHELEVTGEASPQLAGVIKAAISGGNRPAAASAPPAPASAPVAAAPAARARKRASASGSGERASETDISVGMAGAISISITVGWASDAD